MNNFLTSKLLPGVLCCIWILMLEGANNFGKLQPTSSRNSFVSWHLWLRNDSIFSSKTFTDQTLNDLFAYHPRSEILNVAGQDVTQRPLASILNIAPMISFQMQDLRYRSYSINGYLDCGFLPYGMYLSQDTFLENIANEVELLINLAYADIHKDQHRIILGQYLNPLLPATMLPHVVSMNMGAFITPTAVNPQIRYELDYCAWRLGVCGFIQYLYQNDGPQGFSTTYMRNSQVPGLAGNLVFQLTPTTEIGFIAETKRLLPTQETFPPYYMNDSGTTNGIANKDTVQSYVLSTWLKISQEKLTLKAQVLGGQNGSDIMNLGGYSIKSFNTTTGKTNYASLWYYSFWTELESTQLIYHCMQPGIFFGMTCNMGAHTSLAAVPLNIGGVTTQQVVYYGFKDNFGTSLPIVSLWRCAPRCWFMLNEQVNIGLEMEYSYATFGNLKTSGKFENNNKSSLLRFIVSTQFYL